MESELSDIFQVKLFTKKVVRGSPGTQFMHMRVNEYLLLHPSQSLNVNVLILIVYSERSWTFCLLLLAGHFSACYLFTFCPLLCACCPLLFARYCLLVNFFSLSFVRYFFKLVFARYYLFIAPSFLTILRCNYATYKFYTYKF